MRKGFLRECQGMRLSGACMGWGLPQPQPSSPGIAVRRTASLPLAYDRATQYSAASVIESKGRGVLGLPLSRGTTPERRHELRGSRLLLHVLDAGKDDALGAFADIAEIEFVLGQKHR